MKKQYTFLCISEILYLIFFYILAANLKVTA